MKSIQLRRALLLGAAACALNAAAATVVFAANVISGPDGQGNVTISGTGASTAFFGSGVAGTLTNNGQIVRTTAQTALVVIGTIGGALVNAGLIDTRAGGAGILVTGAVTGSVSNSGSILAGQSGILLNQAVGGGITNSGTILAGASLVFGNGIWVQGGVTGDLVNTGAITVNGAGTGIRVGVGVIGNVTNSGVITAATALKHGITIAGNVTGTVSNLSPGTITSGGSAIAVVGNVLGGLINSGNIASSGSSAIKITGSVSGDVTNSGVITASTTGKTAVKITGAVTGTVSNLSTGTITAGGTAIVVSGTAGAVINAGRIVSHGATGIQVGGNVIGNVVNSGTIAMSGVPFSTAGIQVLGNVGGNVVESGVVSGSAVGILVDGSVTGAVSITSTIAAAHGNGVKVGGASFGGPFPPGTGIYVGGSVGGGLINSGVISSDSSHAGVLVVAALATHLDLTNTGTITGNNGIALDYHTNTAPSTITQTSGLITGEILSKATTADVINYNGGSIAGVIAGAVDVVNIGGTVSSGGIMNVGAINVLSNGAFTLGHDVTVSSGFTNAGILNINTARTITGDFTQSAGGHLAIGVNGAVAGGLSVTHNATMTGASTLDVVQLGTVPVVTETFAVVSAGNLGAYTGVTIGLNPFLGLTATKSVVGNNLILTLTAPAVAVTPVVTTPVVTTPTTPVVTPPATIPVVTAPVVTPPASPVLASALGNGASVGAALTSLFATFGPNNTAASAPSILPMINAYFGNTTSPLNQAQKTALVEAQLSPATASTNSQASQSFSFAASGAVSAHAQTARADDNGVQTGLNAGSGSQNSAMWGQIMGFTSRRSSEADTAGNTVTDGGIAFGADTLVSSQVRLGAAFAYGRATAKGQGTDAGNATQIDAYQLTGYGSYNAGAWYLNGQVGVGLSKYAQSRAVIFLPTAAKANYDGTGASAHIDGGKDFQVGTTTLTPIAGLSYSYQTTKAFTETGTGEHFSSVNVSAVQSDVGVQASWRFADGATHYVPTVKLAWLHDFINSPLETTAAIGGVTFQSRSARPKSDGVDVGLAVAVYNLGNWRLTAQYDGDLYSNYVSHSASLNLKVNF